MGTENKRKPAPLEFKPDLEEAARRWDAFYAGEIIDRPVVCVTALREGSKRASGGGIVGLVRQEHLDRRER